MCLSTERTFIITIFHQCYRRVYRPLDVVVLTNRHPEFLHWQSALGGPHVLTSSFSLSPFTVFFSLRLREFGRDAVPPPPPEMTDATKAPPAFGFCTPSPVCIKAARSHKPHSGNLHIDLLWFGFFA